MDFSAWMDGFEAASAPARAVRNAESVVLVARHEQLKARVADPGLSCEDRVALGRELQELFESSYVMCKADLAEIGAASRAWWAWQQEREGPRREDGGAAS